MFQLWRNARRSVAISAIVVISNCCVQAVHAASAFERVSELETFSSAIVGRELRISMIGISLVVHQDGEISGKALGWPVAGTWQWKNGYFCRQMDWSGTEIPYNCQLVEVRDDDEVRFTVDQGKGDSAIFRIR